MARKTTDAIEKTEDDLERKLEPLVGELVITTKPVVIAGVQRKINIGNFETIDVYLAVSMPQDECPVDKAAFDEMVKEAAEIGFAVTSKEVSDRYQFIKEAGKK